MPTAQEAIYRSRMRHALRKLSQIAEEFAVKIRTRIPQIVADKKSESQKTRGRKDVCCCSVSVAFLSV